MNELLNLTGHYNAEIRFDENENLIYFATYTATSILAEDLQKLQDIFEAEKMELYSDNDLEENFLIQITPGSELAKDL